MEGFDPTEPPEDPIEEPEALVYIDNSNKFDEEKSMAGEGFFYPLKEELTADSVPEPIRYLASSKEELKEEQDLREGDFEGLGKYFGFFEDDGEMMFYMKAVVPGAD